MLTIFYYFLSPYNRCVKAISSDIWEKDQSLYHYDQAKDAAKLICRTFEKRRNEYNIFR